jgi:hypothetical protein
MRVLNFLGESAGGRIPDKNIRAMQHTENTEQNIENANYLD